MRGLLLLMLLSACDCGAKSFVRDAALDGGEDGGEDTGADVRTDMGLDDAPVCPAVFYHRPCGEPPDPCASVCACRETFTLEACDLDDEGSCITELPFCEVMHRRSFVSLEELECGLGPDGVELCNWEITFDFGGTFAWRYSDVSEGGTYTCDGTDVTSERAVGNWDRTTDTFTWDGVAYRMRDQACPD